MWNNILDISSISMKHWKSIVLIYSLQLLLGILVAIMAFQQLDGSIGDSLELDRLALGCDRSIFSDMINRFPDIISNIQSRFVVSALMFMLLSIFLHAGLLGNIRKREYSISAFLRNAKKYFLKFLGVASISLLKTLFILAIIWVPFIKYMGNPLETFHSEKSFILTVISLLILSALLIIVIWLWSILSRYYLIDESRLIEAMKKAWKGLRLNFLRYYLVGICLLISHVLITWLYTLVVDDWGAEIWYSILGLIVIQQVFSIIRIWVRVFGFAAIDNVAKE